MFVLTSIGLLIALAGTTLCAMPNIKAATSRKARPTEGSDDKRAASDRPPMSPFWTDKRLAILGLSTVAVGALLASWGLVS